MTMQATGTSTRAEVVVDLPPDQAFRLFFDDMASWWNPDHHLIEAELAEMVVEPRVGGHIYDRGTDGSECRWATVLAYEPPHRVVFSWNITTDWKLETDQAKTSEVEVRFTPAGEGRTRVELEHRNLDRHGSGWEGMRDAVDAPCSARGVHNEARLLQHLQVLRDRRPRDRHLAGELAHGLGPLGEALEDRAPGRVGQGRQRLSLYSVSFHLR